MINFSELDDDEVFYPPPVNSALSHATSEPNLESNLSKNILLRRMEFGIWLKAYWAVYYPSTTPYVYNPPPTSAASLHATSIMINISEIYC